MNLTGPHPYETTTMFGVPAGLRVRVHHDVESNSYWAESPDMLGLVVSGRTLEELQEEVSGAAAGLLEIEANNPSGS